MDRCLHKYGDVWTVYAGMGLAPWKWSVGEFSVCEVFLPPA